MHEPGITHFALILLAGMAGSFHCVGMCGGFVCALGRAPSGTCSATVVRHMVYNVGRLASYVFLGSLAGLAGATLFVTDEGGFALAGQRLLALLAGGLMIMMGLQLLGLLRRSHGPATWPKGNALVDGVRSVLQAPGLAPPLAFGVFNGFLPCPLVYAFLALAVVAADPLHGALLMAVFGLGTFPAMLLAGGLGSWLSWRWRLRGVSIAGAFVVALGLVTAVRGVVPPPLQSGHMPSIVLTPGASETAHRGEHAP